MSTRIRAIITTSVTAVLFFFLIIGVIDISKVVPTLSGDRISVNTLASILLAVLLAMGTMWVLYFKSKNYSLVVIGLFPSLAIFPYVLLADSVVSSIFNNLGQISVSIIATGVYWVVCYLLILTANVLSGSIIFNIPLGQAGKASQFIFSLIAVYFLLAFMFGGAFPILSRVLLVTLFISYLSFASIYALQIPMKQVLMSSLAISVVMALVVLLLSIWPIGSVYATLVAVVLLYIMLNVALEMREKVGTAIWVEYGALILLVVIILFTNGNWGINGTLI